MLAFFGGTLFGGLLGVTVMCLMQIGELAGLLSESYRLEHPQIPWRQIRALCNIIAHNYGSVDKQTAWEIVHQDIPALKAYCESETASC